MLVVAMAAIDERVRMLLTGVLTSDPSTELAQLNARAHQLARVMMATADAHANDALPLAIFAVASVVLAAIWFRT
jgi:hypothetical protein